MNVHKTDLRLSSANSVDSFRIPTPQAKLAVAVFERRKVYGLRITATGGSQDQALLNYAAHRASHSREYRRLIAVSDGN